MRRLIGLLLLFFGLLLGLAVSAGAQGPPSPAVLAVYDANGIQVGSVVGITPGLQRPIVGMRINGVAFVLEVFENRFRGNRRTVIFESSDCSGTPFLHRTEEPLPSASVIPDQGAFPQTLYVADTSSPLTTFVNRSERQDDGICRSGSGSQGIGFPAVQTDLSTLFTPPYTVQAVFPDP